MEGILTLIIIIIIFNLFNFLARSLKGDRSKQKDRVLVEKEELISDHPGQTAVGRDENEKSYDAFFDMQHNEVHEKNRMGTNPKEETVKQVAEENRSIAIEKKGSSARLSGNLKKLLTQKDPLITAFIFHEIIDPPRTRRRKP